MLVALSVFFGRTFSGWTDICRVGFEHNQYVTRPILAGNDAEMNIGRGAIARSHVLSSRHHRLLLQEDGPVPPDEKATHTRRERELVNGQVHGRLALETKQAQGHLVPKFNMPLLVDQHYGKANLLQRLGIDAVDLVQFLSAL